MFTNENSADAVYGSLGESRWSMECDENVNVLSLWWNEGTCHLMGYDYDKEYFQTLPPFTHLHPDDLKHTMTALQNVLNDQSGLLKFDIEHRFLTANGQYKWVRSVGKPIRNEEKKRIKFYGLITDIDDHKKNELKRQKDLIDALAAVKHANNAKTQFLNNMSHDIRTPMNAIIGYAELGEKHLKEPTILEDYFEKILLCGKKMLHLIDNILELARIENNQATLDETITDVSKNFDLCIDMFRKPIEEKHQTLKVNKNIRYPYLHMDDARSSEITINILSNAVKYTGEGGNISCTLNQYPGEKEGWSVLELIIADNGIGMSEEFQKHIFESFSQERSSSDSGIEGSGLGMGIVKKLVDLMNGKITVQSKPGAGSTFTITLPLKIANAEERNPKHADGQLNIKKLEGKRVLLVEDNDLNAEIATELLTEEGIMIERAENGVACIDMFNKAKQNYYSLILMDIQMPIMNGYEASRRIRELKDGNKSQIPIVAMTANAFEEDKKMALASGMNDHVAKPIDMNVLLPTIMKYM